MEGHKAPTVARLLREEVVRVSCAGVSNFLAKFEETGSIGWIKDRIWQTVKITAEMKKLAEDQMHSDFDATVYQLHKLLMSKDNSTYISLR